MTGTFGLVEQQCDLDRPAVRLGDVLGGSVVAWGSSTVREHSLLSGVVFGALMGRFWFGVL